jgi:uncharacterized membrane protein
VSQPCREIHEGPHVSRTQFLSRAPSPPAPAAAPVKAGNTDSQQLTPAAPALRHPVPVLRLAATLAAGQGAGLVSAVLARVASGRPVGTVVLELENTTAIGDDGRDALHGLGGRLAGLGIRLRLAIVSPQVRGRWLADSRTGPLPVHPSLRCAVLACYAMLPGPGLVTGPIRTDLERPAEQLSCLIPFTLWGWSAATVWLVDWRGLTDGKGVRHMADLIAIGYADEATAELAAGEARRLARDLIIEPDAIAVIVRDREGKFHVHTSHHAVGAGATWGMFWGLLFGLLFFIPFFGLAVGAGMGALMGKITKSGIDRQFQDQVRDMLQPGTSALFLMVEKVTPDKAVDALSQFGGTVLKSSLSKDGERELQDALHGSGASPATS